MHKGKWKKGKDYVYRHGKINGVNVGKGIYMGVQGTVPFFRFQNSQIKGLGENPYLKEAAVPVP